ncbi:DUF5689 domain-containing protein [uncultured Duncaniella sp.]|uniref:DUF5689 domain-containing protein n=1 Tax=uncultured Duncaniella sp. TaxID=2768039 RepID=UPI00261B4C1C|nr:DUF5689 domain-containing protein [uncultured Duncaniella sp.]
MRNFKTYISLLFAGALTLTACQDDFDAPAMTDPDSTWLGDTENYEVKTINEIKTQYWEDADNYYKTIGEAENGKRLLVKGRVISSDASGNIYKSLVIQDETGALAMSINANSMNNQYRRGQELVIDLTGMTIGKYAGLQQLGSPEDSPSYGQQTTFMPYELFVEHTQLNGIPNLAEVDTITVNSLTELSGGPEVLRKWQSQLVRFNNCYFADGGKETFAASKETVNRTLTLSDGGTIVVRTSGYSNFYADVLPEGHGDVVGLLSYHSSGGWQLLLLDRRGCMNFGNPTIGPGAEENPYTVDQAISIISGGGTASNVWTTGYIVGAVAPGVQAVSSNDDIQFSSEPDLDNTLVFAQEADCKDWTKCMVITLPQGSKLRQYGNLVDNPANYKKQIWLLGNFGTSLEMPAITGNNGAATSFRIDGVEVPGGDEPTPGQGDGTKESPYTVTQAIALNPTSTTTSPEGGSQVWVTGYIVGSMPTGGSSTTLEGTKFGLTDAAVTNIVIAPTADCTTYTQCIGIQLPPQSVAPGVRSALNLSDNPSNLGKQVTLFGDIMKYCGGPGLKNTSQFVLGEGGSTPDVPTESVSSLDETFPGKVKPAGWTTKMLQGDKEWYFTEFNTTSYAAMTGYKGTAPFDSWLISPAVDMSKVNDKTLSFETQVNGYGSTTTQFEVYVLTSADPANASKSKLNPTIATAPASGYSSWVKSGSLDLSSFSGTIYIGFRYSATTDANYATWCVTNVKLNAGGSTPVDPDPDTPDTPVTGNSADFSLFGQTATTYGTYTSSNGWVAEWSQILSGSATPDGKSTFELFGNSDKDFAVCLNGNTKKVGKLTSPTIAGGLKTLTFNYGFVYGDSKAKLNINILQDGNVVASDVLDNSSMTKNEKYTYSHDFNVSGDFVIEIINASPSNASSNKDRTAIWNLTWTN